MLQLTFNVHNSNEFTKLIQNYLVDCYKFTNNKVVKLKNLD
jgi:hypothetical protein